MRTAAGFLLLSCLFPVLFFGCTRSLRPRPGYTVPPVATAAYTETAAEDIALTDAAGRPVLLSDYLGKPVLLKFWSARNEASMDELPALQRAYDSYSEEIVFLIVNSNDGAQQVQSSVDSFLAEEGYTFPVFYDPDGAAASAYGADSGAPITVFIDADGFIVTRSQGEIDEDTLLFGLRLL